MRQGLLLALALAAQLQALPKIPLDSPRWKMESMHGGICLYSCEVEGTGIVPFKSVMTIPASIEEISAVLEDAPRRWDWIARFGGSELVERKNDYEQTEYVRILMPWPFEDRSTLVRVRISVSDDQSTATIAASSVSCCARASLPELVRAEVNESSFQMRRVGGGTEVTALVFIDPKGNLPKWVVNLFTGGVSRRTLEGLCRQVQRHLYGKDVLEALHHRIQDYPGFKETLSAD